MRCGACCFSESPRHARVTGDDHQRLGDDAEALVAWIGNETFMRIEPVTAGMHMCVALAIDAATGTFACSIYERRPQVCRDLEQGSGGCRGELATKAGRPKRALAMLATRRP
jgi:hypothetical protein